MIEIKDPWTEEGGPAFPSASDMKWYKGMSLRDYFAAKALGPILSQVDDGVTARSAHEKFHQAQTFAQYWAAEAYEIADAMLAEREKVSAS